MPLESASRICIVPRESLYRGGLSGMVIVRLSFELLEVSGS